MKFINIILILKIKPIIVCKTKSDLEFKISKEWNEFEKEIIQISSISGKGLK